MATKRLKNWGINILLLTSGFAIGTFIAAAVNTYFFGT